MIFDVIDTKIAIVQTKQVLDFEIELLLEEINKIDLREDERYGYYIQYRHYEAQKKQYRIKQQREGWWRSFAKRLNDTMLDPDEPRPPYRDEDLFRNEKEDKKKIKKLEEEKKFLTTETDYSSLTGTLKATERVIKELLNSFQAVRVEFVDDYEMNADYGVIAEDYNKRLAILCKYTLDLRKLLILRKKQSEQFISDCHSKSEDELKRIIREYERVKNPLESVRPSILSADAWLKEFYNNETYYLDDVLFELRELLEKKKKTSEAETDDRKKPFEKQIEEIENAIKTELELKLSVEKLIEQYPEQETMLRKKFRRILDELRER